MHLEVRKSKISYPGEGDTPSPGPHSPPPLALGCRSSKEKNDFLQRGEGELIELYNIYPCKILKNKQNVKHKNGLLKT